MSESSMLILGAVMLVLVVAAILSAPVTLGMLWLYDRAMLAEMRRRGSVDASAGRAAYQRPEVVPTGALELDVVHADRHVDLPPDALPTYRRAIRGARLAALVYVAGGVAHALVATAVLYFAAGLPLYPRGALVVFWAYLWPAVIAVGIVAVADWRTRARHVLLYAGLGAALAVSAGESWFAVPLYWFGVAGLPTVCLVPFLLPRLRAVGPLVFAFTIVGVGGAMLAYGVSASQVGELALAWASGVLPLPDRSAASAPTVMGLAASPSFLASGLSALLDGLLVLGVVGFILLGWLTLRWIGRLYEAKYISDQSLLIDLVWLIFTLCDAIQRTFEGPTWTVAALGSFVAYKVVTVAGFALVARRYRATRNHRLLLLRVFGFRERSERLIAMIGSRWRYIGSIQLIAATDLASTTVEPHELLDFAHGQLGDRYVSGHAVLEQQLERMDVYPDADGRYRMNEFFCHDDTWKMTLARLAATDDLVLMDLRGFSPSNQGCCFELDQLIDRVLLSKVVLILDRTTDVTFLRATLDEAWSSITLDSPNLGLERVRVTGIYLERDDRKAARAVLGGLARALADDLGAESGSPAARAVVT